MRNPVYADIISKNIIRLHKEFPEYTIGEHISIALNGRDIYTTPDKELAETLSAYIIEQEINDE